MKVEKKDECVEIVLSLKEAKILLDTCAFVETCSLAASDMRGICMDLGPEIEMVLGYNEGD